MKARITIDQFNEIDLRVGTVLQCEPFTKARNPSYKLWIDFGELGVLKSSAQITKRYNADSLIGKQVIAVINFPPRQIADFMSECLVLGCVAGKGDVIILEPERAVPNGTEIA
jgi:tRNA-binding protein